MRGKQRLFCKGGRGIAERDGEVFDKRAAAGGTGLVEQHGIHRAVLQADEFHVLSADVQHTVGLRIKKSGGGAVRDGLHLAVVQAERRFQQCFAVAGRAGAADVGRGGHKSGKLAHGADGGLDRRAVVIGVERPKQTAVLGDKRELCRGGTGVDAEKAVACIAFKRTAGDAVGAVARRKGGIIRLAFKKRRQTVQLKRHVARLLQPVEQFGQRDRLDRLFGQRRAGRREQVGIVGRIYLRGRQLQRADKRLPQLGEEMERTAEKGDVAADGLAAGKTADRLVDDRLKHRSRQILPPRAVVDQRLNITFGKYAAARGNGIQMGISGGKCVETGSVGFQKRRHLVDKRAGAARADTVHPLLQPAGEIEDLRILAAQFNGDIRLRGERAQRDRLGGDLLHKADAELFGKADAAASGHARQQYGIADGLPRILQKGGKRRRDIGVMAAVFAVYRPASV